MNGTKYFNFLPLDVAIEKKLLQHQI